MNAPENSHILKLERSINWTGRIPLIVSGGNDGASLSSAVFGLSFKKVEVNGINSVEANLEE